MLPSWANMTSWHSAAPQWALSSWRRASSSRCSLLWKVLGGKKIALFGSYGWGDGQWMRDWCERVKEDGAVLFSEEGLICNETPDDDVQAACRKLGADLAAW